MPNANDCGWPIHWFAMRMLRFTFWTAQEGRCGICNGVMSDPLKKQKAKKRGTFDHVWPKSRSSVKLDPKLSMTGNLLLCHASCNADKSDDLPDPGQVVMLRSVNRTLGFPAHKTALWDDEQAEEDARSALSGHDERNDND